MSTKEIINGFTSGWLGKATKYVENPSKLLELLDDLKTMMGKAGLSGVLDELSLLYDFVKNIATGNYKDYSITSLSIAVAAIIYVISPLDLIPDAIAFLGLTDDAAVVTWAVSQICDELQKYKQWKC